MRVKRPALVTFIGDLNFIYAFLVIVSFFPIPKFIEKILIFFIPMHDFLDGIIRILMIISLLIISYGFLSLERWGYWAMIAYNLFFLVVSMILLLTSNSKLGNLDNGFIVSFLGLIITFPSKRYFIKEKESSKFSWNVSGLYYCNLDNLSV